MIFELCIHFNAFNFKIWKKSSLFRTQHDQLEKFIIFSDKVSKIYVFDYVTIFENQWIYEERSIYICNLSQF